VGVSAWSIEVSGALCLLPQTEGRIERQRAAYKHNGRCTLCWGGASTGAKTPEGLQRLSEANMKHGRQTKGRLAEQRYAAKVGRRVLGELKRLERQLLDAGLMPDDCGFTAKTNDFRAGLEVAKWVPFCHSAWLQISPVHFK